ncbi:MAG: 2,3-bisphosphoglycerate-independent phosphoglycerate mutase [Dokdonella sp.]|uniref:2,3-bisphosphoglycerate-independent phosphoglycerate mutase n=2 Tax=Dokdonella sp. TaxID=2291710 RepID=UPI002C354A40|nr:2,3-bisphosphoglycerate-independent phosphoglycerate mutase [Xanthomonadales bacterium]HQX65999.1 2,3-bisphosphoglycerate-independent phosphoglycerate mutase [Dokdonella sp.]HQY55977.1 2,3-bisphosphoglycerate-independent phosphoglycerate mutase [Dokdonella sp.]
MSRPKPVLLLILDGWGYRKETAHNAIALADCPHWRRLLAECPHSLVDTHGLSVGLPDGQMGNSEVGHMNIGAGRIVYQDLTRIDAAIADGTLAHNPALISACDAVKANGGCLHLLGLLSPGGVHSHEEHILAMLAIAAQRGVARIAVHAFLDGRDTPPRSAHESLRKLEARCAEYPAASIATVSGRYYAMDRDQRWDRVKLAWDAIVDARSTVHADSSLGALDAAYAREENDEFVQPTPIGAGVPVADGDAIIFMNFRADRARQLSHAFVDADFAGFERARVPRLSAFVSLTEYAADLAVSAVAFPAQSMDNTLGAVLAAQGLSQLRIAETEKYAHVTFFFSGGREEPFPGEQRILVPSPKVATYDLQPEMSLPELTDRLVAEIRAQHFDFIVCNIANADMVGHSGIESAAIKAAEAIDVALGRISAAIRDSGGEMLITADHGNLEQMVDDNGIAHTQHTVGPVPLVYVGRKARVAKGALRDLAPTVLALMGIAQPVEMSGRNLVEFSA